MKVTYITHSSFLVELAECYLLFDYFKGIIPPLKKEKVLYVFASHKHGDHFDKSIFALAEEYHNITYILSKDIRLSDSYLQRNNIPITVKEKILFAGRNAVLEKGEMKIETLTSTDEGVAFIVTAEGKTIYHAGDLNCWYWTGEAKEWNDKMVALYQKEIGKMKDRHINIAFVPVDPRLGEAYYLGLYYFLLDTDTDYVFPMHFWEDYSVCQKIQEHRELAAYRDKIVTISNEGEVFTV